MQSAQQSAFNLRPAFLGGPNFPGLNVSNAVEPVLVAATAATGTINFDAGVQSIVYFTANASANWTLNIRGSETMRLDTLMKENQVLTVAHLVTQGGTAYYNNALTIDGARGQGHNDFKIRLARNTIVRVLLKHGFTGAVYPVSASNSEIEGLKAYPGIAALPEVPDVAAVITPAHTVPDIVEECGARGVRNVIVYSSGFEEIESGRVHARRLAEAADRHGVAVLGTNCQGVWSVRPRTMLSSRGAAARMS